MYIYTIKCEQAPSWMHHFAADPAKDIEQPANKSEPVVKKTTIADVKGLRFIEKFNRYVLKVSDCEKMYVFQLKDWVTEEAIATAATRIRKDILRSWGLYASKTVPQLKEALRGRKASVSGRREELLRRIVTLSAPVDPTPPTSHNIETPREPLVEQPQPAVFVADETPKLISESDETDESTSAKYKLPAGVLTCFRDYVNIG